MFNWENKKERLSRFMKISPGRKLEWLRQMREFNVKVLPKKTKEIRQKLREKH